MASGGLSGGLIKHPHVTDRNTAQLPSYGQNGNLNCNVYDD